MFTNWIGLEHVGLHPNPRVQEGWKGEIKLNGIGPFTFKKDPAISSAILVESPAWFELQAIKTDGDTVTVQATEEAVQA